MNKPEAVFIDRDGTIGGTGHFLHPRARPKIDRRKTQTELYRWRNYQRELPQNQQHEFEPTSSCGDY